MPTTVLLVPFSTPAEAADPACFVLQLTSATVSLLEVAAAAVRSAAPHAAVGASVLLHRHDVFGGAAHAAPTVEVLPAADLATLVHEADALALQTWLGSGRRTPLRAQFDCMPRELVDTLGAIPASRLPGGEAFHVACDAVGIRVEHERPGHGRTRSDTLLYGAVYDLARGLAANADQISARHTDRTRRPALTTAG